MPTNRFKQALGARRLRVGLWLGLANAYSAEICAGAEFDWLVVDGEHSPNDLPSVLGQLQAIAAYPDVDAVVRIATGHGHVGQMLIKQHLDLGAQTLLVPMVDTAEQAAAIVNAARYPQAGGRGGGIRGVGGARASRWGRIPNYLQQANGQVCLLMQAETRAALDNLESIAAVDGVDGIFIGPSDLSASLGHVGEPGHAEVQAAIDDAIRRVVGTGKAAGILTVDEAAARRCIELGATFVAVGIDTNLLARSTSALAARFKSQAPPPPPGKTG